MSARSGVAEHHIGLDKFHYKWDNSLPPAVEIASGDVVHFDTEEVTSGQLKQGDPASKLANLDFDKLYPLGGPVFVKGAEPGDVLEVEILALQPGSWGWTALLPVFGTIGKVETGEDYIRHHAETAAGDLPGLGDVLQGFKAAEVHGCLGFLRIARNPVGSHLHRQ